MPYVKYRADVKSYGAKRRSSYNTTKRTARKTTIAAARKKPANVRTNRKLALSNARSITKLTKMMWGPVQYQTSKMNETLTPLRMHPHLIHVSNPNCGHEGARIWTWHSQNAGVITSAQAAYHHDNSGNGATHFAVYTGQGANAADANAQEQFHVANGPRCMLRSVELHFKFSGHRANTNLLIQVFRQKTLGEMDYWQPKASFQFLPDTITGLTDMAGWTENRLDPRKYQLLATRRILMNSKNDGDVDATTRGERECKIFLRLNKVLKQLKSSINETNGFDDLDMNNGTVNDDKGSYSSRNQHPLSNIWCLVSSDDPTELPSWTNGQHIDFELIRRVKWQDERG